MDGQTHLPQRHTLIARLADFEVIVDRLDHLGFARREIFERHETTLGLHELDDFCCISFVAAWADGGQVCVSGWLYDCIQVQAVRPSSGPTRIRTRGRRAAEPDTGRRMLSVAGQGEEKKEAYLRRYGPGRNPLSRAPPQLQMSERARGA